MHALAGQLGSALALAAEADRRGLVRSGLWLLIALAGLGVVVVAVVWLFSSGWSRRARRPRAAPARRGPPVPDAWAEAGRRSQPLPPDGQEPADDGDTWSPSEN